VTAVAGPSATTAPDRVSDTARNSTMVQRSREESSLPPVPDAAGKFYGPRGERRISVICGPSSVVLTDPAHV
jgi:hypothetical protein